MPFPGQGEYCQDPCTFYNIHGRNDEFFPWDGFAVQIVVADPISGLTTIRWNITNTFLRGCCPFTALTFTAGGQTYVVPANALGEGSYPFPLPVADGVIITATYTNCNGTFTQDAFDNRVGDNCAPKFEFIPKKEELWALMACGLTACSCVVPISILVGGVEVGVIDRDGKFHVTNPQYDPNSPSYLGTQIDGDFNPNLNPFCCGEDGGIPDSVISLGFTPGLAPGTLVQANINSVLWAFAPYGCLSTNPIAGVCTPGGGGGALFPTMSSDGGSMAIVQTTNPNGSPNFNIEVAPGILSDISDNTSDIAGIVANNNDFQAAYNASSDWIVSGLNWRLLINHNFGNAPGIEPVSQAFVTATNDPFVPAQIVVIDGNTLAYDVLQAPDGREAITVVVKRSTITT